MRKTAHIENIKDQIKTRFSQILTKRQVRLPASVTQEIQDELMQTVESAKSIYETEIATYLSQIGRIQAEANALREENANLKAREKLLTQENTKNGNRIKVLENQRPKFTPEQLSLSFQKAMERMEEAFEASKNPNVIYTISDLDVELKANVSLEDQKVIIKTPKIAEEVPPSSLSTLSFKITKEPRIAKEKTTIMVPNLIGSTKESAIRAIENAGLKVEETGEMESTHPPGTVIDQSPDPFSKVEPGFPISLVLSMEVVEVPNVVGMTRADAEKALSRLGLKTGKATVELANVKAGTVLSQHIIAKTKVHKGTTIDLVVSGKKPS